MGVNKTCRLEPNFALDLYNAGASGSSGLQDKGGSHTLRMFTHIKHLSVWDVYTLVTLTFFLNFIIVCMNNNTMLQLPPNKCLW